MDLEIKGRIAVVNGASQGIGFAIAKLLAEEGAEIAIAARRQPALDQAAEAILAATGRKALAVTGDIRKAEDCARIASVVADSFGGIDILINNDGAPPLGRSLEFDDEAWHRAVDQNLMSVVRMCRAVVPYMRERGAGSIVNISALSMLQPQEGFGLSVATWAAVMGLAKTLSLELARDNITINTICPGLIETPRLHKVTEQSGQAMRDMAAQIPVGRVGKPEDIAALTALLVSPRGSYITGTTTQIDGGLLRGIR
jgi:3-oxoacyl-[acyl-carrier protein] reductase